MRTIPVLALFLAFIPAVVAEDDVVDVLRAKQAREREEAAKVAVSYTAVYVIDDLAPLYAGGPKRSMEKLRNLVRQKVPTLRHDEIAAFPTNLSLVVSTTEADHKNLADYLAKLRAARKLLKEAAFEILETN